MLAAGMVNLEALPQRIVDHLGADEPARLLLADEGNPSQGRVSQVAELDDSTLLGSSVAAAKQDELGQLVGAVGRLNFPEIGKRRTGQLLDEAVSRGQVLVG